MRLTRTNGREIVWAEPEETGDNTEIEENERSAMKVTMEITAELTREIDGHRAIGLATVDRLWCPALLPDGTQGHWFLTEDGNSLICHDLACPCHGQVVHQCPLHRGLLGSTSAPSTPRERAACR